MKKKSILLLSIVLLFTQPVMSFNSYQKYEGTVFESQLLLNYYKTDSNFNSSGQRQDLIAGNTFQVLEFKPEVRYQSDSDFGFHTGLSIVNAESNDAFFSRKNSVLNNVKIGFDYLFMRSIWYRFFGQISYSNPLQKFDNTTDQVLSSDGATEVNPEIFLNFDFEDGFSSLAKLGLNIRGEGLSTLTTYALGAEYQNDGFGLGAMLLGKISVKNDNYTDQASFRDALTSKVNAGSFKYNSVNPNSHDIEVYTQFEFINNLKTKLFAGYNIMGSNTSLGYNAGIQVDWNFELNPENQSQSIQKNQNEKTQSKDETTDFKINTNDGVNQEYFKPVNPPKKEYIQQIEGSQKSLNEATTPDSDISLKSKPAAVDPNYKIKLKRIKKK